MILIVYTLTQKRIQLEVDPEDYIISIQEKIEDREGIPPAVQFLVAYGTKLMDPALTIKDYNLRNDSEIQLRIRLTGDSESNGFLLAGRDGGLLHKRIVMSDADKDKNFGYVSDAGGIVPGNFEMKTQKRNNDEIQQLVFEASRPMLPPVKIATDDEKEYVCDSLQPEILWPSVYINLDPNYYPFESHSLSDHINSKRWRMNVEKESFCDGLRRRVIKEDENLTGASEEDVKIEIFFAPGANTDFKREDPSTWRLEVKKDSDLVKYSGLSSFVVLRTPKVGVDEEK